MELKQKFINDAGITAGYNTSLTNASSYRKDGSFVPRIQTPRSAMAKVTTLAVKNVAGVFHPTFSASSPWLRGNR